MYNRNEKQAAPLFVMRLNNVVSASLGRSGFAWDDF
jgi:hypothetical protein